MYRNMSTASYKFSYFDGKGRGELSRLVFAIAGRSYDDHRIKFDDWAKLKPTCDFQFLPHLTFNGRTYCDSMAIAKYLAREFGYGGKNNLEMLVIDMVCGIVGDIFSAFVKFNFEKDEKKKAEIKKKAYAEDFPRYLSALEKTLKESGTNYYVGEKVTLADVACLDALEQLIDDSLVSKYPKVKQNMKLTSQNDRLKAYREGKKGN